jgi:membrane fusion protein, multidrug efflux system
MIRTALCLLMLALYGCAKPPAQDGLAAGIATGTPVTVTAVKQQPIDYVLTALGSVESIHHPTISAEISGQVIGIEVSEGQAIVAQQLLATIDNTLHGIEADKAIAELQRQEVLLDNQQRDVDRLLQLAKSQSVSRDKLEDEQAQLQMLVALRNVALKQKEQALYLESKTRVHAPQDGLIARRHVSVGDYVATGQPLFSLVSVNTLRARLAFPEHDAASITIGKEVQLVSPVAPQTVASGMVTSINPQINPRSRAIEVIVEFDNPGGWYPGASVDATLVIERKSAALTVPALSVVQRASGPVVFIANDNRASQQAVVPGQRQGDWVEILEGLGVDDRVVVEGSALISDGSAVIARAGNTTP